MRQTLVVGNWKMNGSKAMVEKLLSDIKSRILVGTSSQVVVCPPFMYLQQASSLLSGTDIQLGAQNVFSGAGDAGAFTGETSSAMLSDVGCSYVIVGHSERRKLFAEGADALSKKIEFAQFYRLIPILCVGEVLEERESGLAESVVSAQIVEIIEKVGIQAFSRAVVAYEPIWAIGTGKTATPDVAQDMHRFIRSVVARYDPVVASELQLLYGGSVKADNALNLFGMQDIDGALVGGASLDAESFSLICRV